MNMEVINIGLIGFGNVGQGFVKVLDKEVLRIKNDYGYEVKIAYIVDPVKGSAYSKDGLDLGQIIKYVGRDGNLKNHPNYIPDLDSYQPIYDREVDLIVEVTPTNLVDGEPGYSHIRKSLEEGKHVITSNKGPIALYYRELTRLAEKRGLYLGFEGTVMSGTPLIKLIRYGLSKDILTLRGILNGTTNFILTKMENGYTFEEALKEAQKMGYAEADPSMDIDGYDLIAKAAILANVITDGDVKPSNIFRMSLREYLQKEGYKKNLKYLVNLEINNHTYSVIPRVVDSQDILASVKGVNNGVVIETKLLGEIFIYGPGAGRLETGYAILTDLLELLKTHVNIRI